MAKFNSTKEFGLEDSNDASISPKVIDAASPRVRRSNVFSADDISVKLNHCSDDSGIDWLTRGLSSSEFDPIQTIARLTDQFNLDSANKRNTTKELDVGNLRPRNLTIATPDRLHAKSLPGTPRRSIDAGYMLSNQNGTPLNYWSRRKASNINLPIRDSVSTMGDMENNNNGEDHIMARNSLTVMFSSIYAVLVVVIGSVFYVTNQNHTRGQSPTSEVFNIVIILLGMFWLSFLHIDLHRYKSSVLKRLREHEDNMADNISTTTEAVCNQSWLPDYDNDEAAYFFVRGRHSGSFYLKTGMAVFCFGHLISQGLVLGEQIIYYMDEQKMEMNCTHETSIVLNILWPLFSFYQMFVIFKYSNIIINRYVEMARFGLMHLIACCLCFWFNTIVKDGVTHFQHLPKNFDSNSNSTESSEINVTKSCAEGTIFDSDRFQAIPYLYPFTIEYNIILAGVWFIVWQNIGTEHHRADPHHFERKVSMFDAEVTYQSNLVISADCHSANKGLFAGLFVMLITIVTVIVFFIAITNEDHIHLGVIIYTSQEMTLCLVALVGILIAYSQLIKMDINLHPVTFLDDVLLFIPLPFFFANSILSAMAELDANNILKMVSHILISLQVIVQTPCIIDGLRRCCNSQIARYKKPGREVITFLIVLNLSLWIVNTFEQKNVEPFSGIHKYFGELQSVFIGHITYPLMLFYRFHSSVCLADIWKSAYEKGE